MLEKNLKGFPMNKKNILFNFFSGAIIGFLIIILAFLLSCTGPIGPSGESGVVIWPDSEIKPDSDIQKRDNKLSSDFISVDQKQQKCIPDKIYCDGSKHRRCSETGEDSILLYDCSELNAGNIKFNCESCSGKYSTCKPVNSILTGSVSLPDWSGTINWEGDKICGAEKKIEGRVQIVGTVATLYIRDLPTTTKPALTLWVPLNNGTTDWGNLTGASTTSCWSSITRTPPGKTEVKVTYGKIPPEKGDSISIAATGWLWCQNISWKAFSINLTGWIY